MQYAAGFTNPVPLDTLSKIWILMTSALVGSLCADPWLDAAGKITTAGTVGVGTPNPQNFSGSANQLVINRAGGNAGMTIATDNNRSGGIFFADGTSGNSALEGFIQYNHTSNSMLVGTAASTRIVIDAMGKVGIGLPSPAYTLDVAGTARFSQNAVFGSRVSVASAQDLNFALTVAAIGTGGGGKFTSTNFWAVHGLGTTTTGNGVSGQAEAGTGVYGWSSTGTGGVF